ncbi:MAG: NAD-dependent protein deacylase [Lachnospiraceae bacterium]|nr:NAD-dependent protein deacylase [Lachnospiraceae bacterium]
MNYQEKLDRLKSFIEGSGNIVFFGGAGVSTESGIPDFRSVDGLYNLKYKWPPEQILSHTFYRQHPDEFFRFYRDKIIHMEAKPNAAHLKLAQWEEEGKLKAVVTQNIDGLHQAAGSRRVYELHGSILRNYCEKCGKFYDVEYMALPHAETDGVPMCSCGGRIKPDVVLYEEGLDQNTINGAVAAIAAADVLIIGGTSLVVYPAAGLIDYYRGNKLVVINKAPTARDEEADLVIDGAIGEVFSAMP